MDFDEAATAIVTALVGGAEFDAVTITADGSVSVPVQRDAPIGRDRRDGAERIATGLRMVASQLRPSNEPVAVTRAELLAWFEGRDGLEAATPRCDRCLVPLDIHPTAEAWLCPCCGQVLVTL